MKTENGKPNTAFAFDRLIGIKVDVDTFRGMGEGVPRLIDLFRRHTIRASFFVPMGKDHTGWTVKRVFTRPGFVSKAQRVGVLETYGVKTLMYGLLLPGPQIAEKNKDVLKRITDEGHELGIHGLDHVWWHDHIRRLDGWQTERVLGEATRTFERLTGTRPLSFAAPGWVINGHALAFFEREGFVYSSDARGTKPFRPVMDGRSFPIIQIPTTLPTLDEMVGLEGTTQEGLAEYFAANLTEGLNILTVHAELEGNRWGGFLEGLIARAADRGYRFAPLIDIAHGLDRDELPVCEIVYGTVRGRAGDVTLQKDLSGTPR